MAVGQGARWGGPALPVGMMVDISKARRGTRQDPRPRSSRRPRPLQADMHAHVDIRAPTEIRQCQWRSAPCHAGPLAARTASTMSDRKGASEVSSTGQKQLEIHTLLAIASEVVICASCICLAQHLGQASDPGHGQLHCLGTSMHIKCPSAQRHWSKLLARYNSIP